MKKSINSLFIKTIIIFVINYFLLRYFGNLYLNKFNIFIKENNSVMLKNELNRIIKRNPVLFNGDIYKIIYNSNKEIINVSLNISEINSYLSNYILLLNESFSDLNYSYLNKYYKYININNNHYYLLPLGMISNNPFIYNSGPKVIIFYEFINTPSLKISVDIKNYGLNNALVETYLYVHVDQSILKPILTNISSYDYRYLLSSNIINGRVPSYLGGTLNIESDSISSN